jgi:hypothetical protein
MAAPDQPQDKVLHQNISPTDVRRFEQALVNPHPVQAPFQAEQVSASAIGSAIAKFEGMEKKSKEIVSGLAGAGTEITAATLLEFDVAMEERNLSYSFAKQVISAPSQWIKELTSLQ